MQHYDYIFDGRHDLQRGRGWYLLGDCTEAIETGRNCPGQMVRLRADPECLHGIAIFLLYRHHLLENWILVHAGIGCVGHARASCAGIDGFYYTGQHTCAYYGQWSDCIDTICWSSNL